jgi:ribosome recycling factor
MKTLDEIYSEAREKMEKSVESLIKELSHIRTGRANISLLEDITVDYYGQSTQLNHVGTVSVPEPRVMVIKPWDKTLLPAIEKAILASNLGITPQNDGNVIRLLFPPLTEERRRELVKVAKKHGEETKIAVRNIRRGLNDEIKNMEKNSEISEDICNDGLEEIQKITDEFIEKIDEIIRKKEDEIMEV